MSKLTDEHHVAKNWVETNFPELGKGPQKAALILAYGAGLDRGMAEALELFEEAKAEVMGTLIPPPGTFHSTVTESS